MARTSNAGIVDSLQLK